MKCADTSGSVTATVAVGIFCLLALVALVADLGYLYVVKCELQNAAEAAAFAGSRALFPVPPVSGLIPVAPDCDRARAAALDTVRANRAAGQPLIIPPEDVQIGIWDWSLKTLLPAPCSANTNAVRVVTRKDEKANGPVVLTFARIFGLNTMSLTAQATAMVDGIGKIPKGKGAFSLALKQSKVPPLGGGLIINLSPNHSDSGGWHTFFDASASAEDLKKLVKGDTLSPEIKVGDWISLTNGVLASVFQEMKHQFDVVHKGEWTILCPVIADGNAVGQAQVLGFTAFKVTEVLTSPDNLITGYTVSHNLAGEAEGGGPNFGTVSSHPRLVE